MTNQYLTQAAKDAELKSAYADELVNAGYPAAARSAYLALDIAIARISRLISINRQAGV